MTKTTRKGEKVQNKPVCNTKTTIMSEQLTQAKELEASFFGKGESKGDYFQLLRQSKKAYLYKRSSPEGNIYFEVFKKKINQQYNCVSYPKSKSFGIWAWCFTRDQFTEALQKFYELTAK